MAKVFLTKLSEVDEGRYRNVTVEGVEILFCRRKDGSKAFRNFCPHMGGKMRYNGEEIICNWHGARFEIEKGCALKGVAEGSKLEEYVVSIEGDDVFVELPENNKSPWADNF